MSCQALLSAAATQPAQQRCPSGAAGHRVYTGCQARTRDSAALQCCPWCSHMQWCSVAACGCHALCLSCSQSLPTTCIALASASRSTVAQCAGNMTQPPATAAPCKKREHGAIEVQAAAMIARFSAAGCYALLSLFVRLYGALAPVGQYLCASLLRACGQWMEMKSLWMWYT